MTNETARSLLHRHGLPEDVIDGALCLHAQELAAVQRADAQARHARSFSDNSVFELKGARVAADLIDPTRGAAAPVVVEPPAGRAGLRDRIAEAALSAVEAALGDTLVPAAREEALAGIVAVLPPPADRAAEIEQLRTKNERMRHELEVMYGGAFDSPDRAQNADRAAVLREVAALLHQRASSIDALSSSDFGEEARAVRELAEAAETLRRMADETPAAETQRCAHCTHPKGDHDGRADHRAKYPPLVAGEPWCHACNAPCDYAAVEADTLPAWLYQRFMPGGTGWDSLDDGQRSYWEHQAHAVRRAVARGGFKQPATGARVADETATTETVPCVRPEPHPAHLHSGLRQGVAVHGRCPGEPAAGARQDATATAEPAPGSTEARPCRTFVSGGTVWCCEEGETDCPCVCHQPAAGARQNGAQR